MAKKRILTEYQLERLKEHKYSVTGNTIMDPVMQVYWNWLVKKIPMTWAPNAITLIGLICNIVTTILLMLYCPNGFGSAPFWCYALCGVGLFIYQSLDAIDGKQARRTSSSSPLGELFDHGCDAMSMVLIVVGAGISTQLGTSPFTFMIITMIATTLFYLAQWRTYVTSAMNFGLFDVTEGQLVVIALYYYNGIFGEGIWEEQLFGLQLKQVFWLIATIFGLVIIYNFVCHVFLNEEARLRNQEYASLEGKKKRFIPYIMRPGVLLLWLWLLLIGCSLSSRAELLENNPVLFLILFGVVSTKMSCLVLVGHMTKSEVCLLDPIFLGPCVLMLFQVTSLAHEQTSLIVLTALCLMNLLYYVFRVCSDICDYLDIYCFKLKPVTLSPKWSESIIIPSQ